MPNAKIGSLPVGSPPANSGRIGTMSCWVNGIRVEGLANFNRCGNIARTDEGACQKVSVVASEADLQLTNGSTLLRRG